MFIQSQAKCSNWVLLPPKIYGRSFSRFDDFVSSPLYFAFPPLVNYLVRGLLVKIGSMRASWPNRLGSDPKYGSDAPTLAEQGLVPCVTTDEVSVGLLQFFYFVPDFDFKIFVYLQHNMCLCTFSVVDGYSLVLSCSWNCIMTLILSIVAWCPGYSLFYALLCLISPFVVSTPSRPIANLFAMSVVYTSDVIQIIISYE